MSPSPAFSRPSEYVERVLEVVERIPPGKVMSYGDIAEYLGEGGPRQVGAVMSAWGGGVPWWRVIRADGTPPPGHETEAAAHYAAEATPMRPGTTRVDMRAARWEGDTPRHMGRPEDW
ncbi:MGMT family protein [Streptomonospora nanhaiensis]|uniref:Alkylated DNA nucleotide flippase Atl1 n=1 Tax=Streptomonospora nanhaiensis TaxID=1323731 RepID=A0A853BTU1_9ACTN|nr:MGMT family protein [Streptomonospora nanhaiensis]MBV2362740.1 MGMT family protein [Streptomonospora nanhaiensis]MBX9389772.1 MGMT family protein [Streptomonospora nanhaiensis]NYI97911.1 alkylated DNA nucleotide flippase Atl1 [Streptomonospora nanhaiensis]